MSKRLVVLGVATALLGGCALGPAPPKPQASLPPAFEASVGGAGAAVDLDHWWRAYGDPQLTNLIEQALKSAPDAQVARTRLQEAGGLRSAALTLYNPQGGLVAGVAHSEATALDGPAPVTIPGVGTLQLDGAGAYNTWNVGLNVSWELDLFGRARANRLTANADLAAAQFQYQASYASLAAAVADQVFLCRGLAIEEADARETRRIVSETARAAEARARDGVGSVADARLAASETSGADAEVERRRAALHAARRSLLVLLGRGTDPLDSLILQEGLNSAPHPPLTVPGELLGRRPDVREAEAQVIASGGRLRLDELALLPKFTLQPGVGVSRNLNFGLLTSLSFWSVGLGLAQPILDIPRLKAEIGAQGARADRAAINYQHVVQVAYAEVDDSLVNLAAAETQVERLSEGEAEARFSLEAARYQFNAGIKDLTAELIAERSWRTTRSALTGARVDALRRSVQAFKALGGGWERGLSVR